MEYEPVSFKEIIVCLKFLPRILKLLFVNSKSYLILIIVLTLIKSFIPSILILVTQILLNSIQTLKGKSFSYILTPMVIYLCINFFYFLLGQMLSYLQFKFQCSFNYNMNLIILKKVNELKLCDFENSDIYNKLKRAQDQAIDKPYAIFNILMTFFNQIIVLISVSMILILWRWWVILVIMLMPIVSSLFMMKIGYLQYDIEKKRTQDRRKIWYSNYLLTNDIACKEIKLFDLFGYFINIFKEKNKKIIKQDIGLVKKRMIITIIFTILDQIISGIIFILIIKDVFLGRILIGNTIAYIRSISNVQDNANNVLSSISSFYQNSIYVTQLFEFLDLETKKSNNDLEKIKNIDSIEFKNVSFKYQNSDRYILKNISFFIRSGETVALVGENGSGKTTLIKLILGFYDNYEGEILINNKSITKVNLSSVRKKVAVLFQDFVKYELTAKENVGLGDEKFINNDERIKLSINKAGAKEFVDKLPSGIDTQLGVWFDDGIQLSGGQWQKIALSRGFFRDADCFILDEPSSALDPISENILFNKLNKLTNNKIGIFITHRLVNVRNVSNRVIVIKDGRIIEEGNHEELINDKSSYYSYLYKLQNG